MGVVKLFIPALLSSVNRSMICTGMSMMLVLVFTCLSPVQVFHGADSDVLWLQRDFGVYIVGMFDTHQASRALGFPRHRLQDLLQRYCSVETNKDFQLEDWRIRSFC